MLPLQSISNGAILKLTEPIPIITDVVVIGSGPAGLAAAIDCQRAGLSTIVVTEKTIENPAGQNVHLPSQSIHPGAASLLSMLQSENVLTAATRSNYKGILVNEKFVPFGQDASGEWEGHHIDRDVFDFLLAENARAAGVEIYEGSSVKEITVDQNRVTGIRTSDGKIIAARYVIDASGNKRVAGKKLKFRERFFSPPLIARTGKTGKAEIPFNSMQAQFIPSPHGWTWLAPETDGSCTWTTLALKQHQNLSAPEMLAVPTFPESIHISNMRWRVFRPLVKEGLLLCGDAAGILDPAAGQGIINALRSGIMAAHCVKKCMNDFASEQLLLAQYDDWFIRQYEEKAASLSAYYKELGINFS